MASRRSGKPKRPHFQIREHSVAPGSRAHIDLPVGVFINHAQVDLGLTVLHGRQEGPTLLVTGCVHGDEITGAEIIRRLLRKTPLRGLRGTILAVPIVNVPAFLNRSRYLPDRRDLNRLFPGSEHGSLGARLAKVVTSELIPRCDVHLDLHSGAINRPNLPQVRVTVDDQDSIELAEVFNAPVTVLAPLREHSLRAICAEQGKPVLLLEAGEALRLDTDSIRYGLRGIRSVMRHLGMLARRPRSRQQRTHTIICRKTFWERAPVGGLFTPLVALGKTVEKGQDLGFIADPFGGREVMVTASRQGILIGRTNEGLADEGDALFHIAAWSDLDQARDQLATGNQAFTDTATDLDDHPVPYHPFMDEVQPSDEEPD